jgi:hypothetical protein
MQASAIRSSPKNYPRSSAALTHGVSFPLTYTTLCRRQKTLSVQIPYRRADGPLNLLVDSTGIKFPGDGEWQARKHGVQGRR